MSSTDSGCAACQRYGELTDFSCPEQWVRSHRNVQPRRRALRTPLAAPAPSRITGRHALDPTAPRPIAAATPLGFPSGSPPGRSSERLERARPGSLGRAVEAEALPGTAGSGARRPQITFPPPEEPTGGFCCPEATPPVHRQLIPGRRGPQWGRRRPPGRRRCPRTGRST